MRLRKAIKKIVALGTGATMMGATLMGAMAADLSNYPSPFIKDGAFSGVMVIGDKAAAEDVVGVSDIAVSLQFASTKTVGTTTGTESVVTGDVFRISASGDELNILEELNDVKSAVGKSELDALKTGTFTNDKGTYTYDQYVMLGNSSVQFVVSEESDVVEDPHLYLYIAQDDDSNNIEDGSEVFRYKLTFPTAAKSDVDTSCDLDDYDNKKITMLGKEYTITNTEYTNAGKLTLEMMGGAVTSTMEEGESKTFTIDGVPYEVRVDTITDTAPYKVKFTINSEVTDALEATETFTLADKTQVGIKELLPNEAGDVSGDVVTFYLGAKKLKLEDSNSSSANADGTLTIGTNDITDGAADMVWTNTSGGCGSADLSLSTLQIAWQSGDNYYVPIGGKLSEHVEDDTDVVDLLDSLNIDFEFAGMKPTNTDTIKIVSSGSTNLKLKMKNKGGQSLSEELWWLNSSSVDLRKDAARPIVTLKDDAMKTGGMGEHTYGQNAEYPLQNFSDIGVTDEDFFVVSTNKYSHLMQMKKFSKSNKEITLKDVGSGDTETVTVSSNQAKFYKDGYEYILGIEEDSGFANATLDKISGDDDGDGQVSQYRADLWTEFGAQIILFNNATVIGEGVGITRDDSAAKKTNITVKIAVSSSKLTPNVVRTNGPIYSSIAYTEQDPTIALDSDTDKTEGYTVWGSFIEVDTSGDQDTVTITYPEDEAVANVYLTAGVTTLTQGTTEGAETVTMQRIEVGATKLASEVAGQELTQNMILVGGPCANAATAVIMGSPADCLAGFEPGKAILQLFENDGNVAMLVAGYSAADTRAATSVVANYGDYTLTGEKMEVTTATSTVKEVAVVVAAE